MAKQKHLACAFLVLAAVWIFSGSVFADGGMIPPDYGLYDDIIVPEQKAVLYWDGYNEELILSTKVSLDKVTDFAWVVPIQSSTKPEVDEADEEIFFEVAKLFRIERAERNMQYLPTLGGMTAEAPQVQVIETKEIDIYDITILKATDGSALLNWLNQNGYSFPEDKQKVLDYYIRLEANYNKPFYFVANKVNLQNKYPGIAISDYDRECVEAFYLDERVVFEPYIAENIEAFVESEMTYYDECDFSSPNSVKALAALSLGISTPLKYTFTPLEPTYPMHMTSINEGYTEAKLFLIGQNCFEDKEGYFSFQAAVQNPGFAQSHGFEKGNCITEASFYGSTSKLRHDSFFSENPFKPVYDPNYVSPQDRANEAFLLIIGIVIFAILFAFLVAPLALFFFGVGVAVCWLEGQLKRSVPKLINTILFKAIAVLPILAMGLFLGLAFFEIYFWVPFLFTIFFAGFTVAGYICFKKKSLKLGIISFVGLLLALLIIFSILLALSIPPIVY